MPANIVYNAAHGIAICGDCETALIPDAASIERHFRAKPHQLLGSALKETVLKVLAYQLKSVHELRRQRPHRTDQCPRIPSLAAYSGVTCLDSSCSYSTRRLRKMYESRVKYGVKVRIQV